MEFNFSVADVMDRAFPLDIQREVAGNILAACRFAKNLGSESSLLYKRNFFGARILLPIIIDRHMALSISKGQLPFEYRELEVSSNAYPYVEYYSDILRWQVKSVQQRGGLPVQSSFRCNESFSNQLFLGDDFRHPLPEFCSCKIPFALLTYRHCNFDLKFVNIGFPQFHYKGWIQIFSLSINDKEIQGFEEKIYEENTPQIKEEILQEISGKVSVSG